MIDIGEGILLSEQLKKVRLEMASKAKHRRTRVNSFSRELPTDWGPEKIENPDTGFPFSDDSAWSLIADLLENETQQIEVIVLKKPPGLEAFVILHKLKNGSILYIKIHLGSGDKVIGRSFHISYR
jgi:hypothetical protein